VKLIVNRGKTGIKLKTFFFFEHMCVFCVRSVDLEKIAYLSGICACSGIEFLALERNQARSHPPAEIVAS